LEGPTIEHLQSIYDNSPCGLLTLSAQGEVLTYNQTFANWLGDDSTLEHHSKFTSLLSKGGRLYFQLFIEPMLRLHGVVNEISLEIETDSGKFDCLFSASPIPSTVNEPSIYNVVIFKVTDRKKYEVELLNQKLLADTNTQNSRDQLRTVAFAQSHLVRAPLANILGLISIMNSLDMNNDLQEVHAMLQESANNLDKQIRSIITTASHNI
jgi:sigma-B regulation protein RsbU (phosphoserine phosphatase)